MKINNQLLVAKNISKFFPGVKALQDVDFSLDKGEIMALLGENGAGKSTLVKCLTGVYPRDKGDIILDGETVDPQDTAHAQSLGIGTVYQEVNLLPNMSVADNLFIGREPRKMGFVHRPTMYEESRKIMRGFGFDIDVTLPLNQYSVAMQQIIAIARAVSLSAKVLILDEPTASLDTHEVTMLFAIMRNLRQRGISMVFITHFLDQVYEITDRITVLRNGQLVGTCVTKETPQIELVQMMLGRELEDNALQRAGKTKRSNTPYVSFENLGKKGYIEPFDFDVYPGEIVGLAGLLGSGRSETAKVIFGIEKSDGGSIKIKQSPVSIKNPRQASALGFGFCPDDRKNEGIIASASVRDNIILAYQAQRGWFRPLSRTEQNEAAKRFVEQLAIKTPSLDQAVANLSGGNQQKVLLARWLLTKPQFLILDEPTRGIDVGAHAEIIRLIESLCANGLALLVISSELEELVGYADRVFVLRDRRQVKEIAAGELSVPAIMEAIAG